MSSVETLIDRAEGQRPTLTVVVIVFNDAHRLPRAVNSLLRQSLHTLEIVIVDDASTDASGAVADTLASRHSERVRALHLPDNSGGCSRPRNVGIDAARGRWVMFLDSDDVLPPGACRTLVEAAEEADADFSSGLCMRVHVNKGMRMTAWYQWLYTQRVVYASALDNPDLVYDTLSTNKCYRRTFLLENNLRFPEGYHYEDLLFSAKAYLAAARIALVPDVVYHWLVIDDPETPSISNQRADLRNFEDRIRIHKLIDAEFIAKGAEALKLSKDIKFLRHDLRLYIGDLPYRDAAFRREFLAVAKDYLSTLDPRAFDRAPHMSAIVAWLILHDDEPNLLNAIDYVAHAGKLSTRLVEQDDRVYWCAEHLDTPEGRAVLDVTELELHTRPLFRLEFYDQVLTLEIDGSRLLITGEILNQLDRIPRDAQLGVELLFNPRRRPRDRRGAAADSVDHLGDVLRWTADVDLATVIKATGFHDRVWDVRVRLTVDDMANIGRLSTRNPEHDGIAVQMRPRVGRIAADQLATLVTPAGDIAFEFVPGTKVAQAIHRGGQRVINSSTAYRARDLRRKVRTAARNPRHPRLMQETFRRTLLRLPARPSTVVFESDGGARFAGNPRAIYEEIQRRRLPVRSVWVHDGDPSRFPSEARRVRHGSLGYYSALARASHWVSDRNVPIEAVKRPGTVHVQAGHGTPLSWAGFDASRMRRASEAGRAALRAQIDTWDALVTRAPYDADVLTRAYRFAGETLPVGYPRNDTLVTGADAAVLAELRGQLGIQPDQQVVLHVPDCDQAMFTPDRSVLADRQVLVVRPGDPDHAVTTEGAVDAAGIDDLAGLLSLADVLITDHHPCLFDMPLRRRPVIVIGCRCSVRSRRGSNAETYIDLDAEAPGPTVWKPESLGALLSDVDGLSSRHTDDMERVIHTYGAFETGKAAAQVVDFMFGSRR